METRRHGVLLDKLFEVWTDLKVILF
jgi:hypothetical protein